MSQETEATPAVMMNVVPLVYTKQELAAALQVGLTTLDRMRAENRLPSPISYSSGKGGSLYWSRRAIEEWVNEGCPNVADWERRRRQN